MHAPGQAAHVGLVEHARVDVVAVVGAKVTAGRQLLLLEPVCLLGHRQRDLLGPLHAVACCAARDEGEQLGRRAGGPVAEAAAARRVSQVAPPRVFGPRTHLGPRHEPHAQPRQPVAAVALDGCVERARHARQRQVGVVPGLEGARQIKEAEQVVLEFERQRFERQHGMVWMCILSAGVRAVWWSGAGWYVVVRGAGCGVRCRVNSGTLEGAGGQVRLT